MLQYNFHVLILQNLTIVTSQNSNLQNIAFKQMTELSKNNDSFYHFTAYCISFVGYGAIFTGLGPLIPYLAENQNVSQTDYSFLFLYRAIGFVIGSVAAKFIEKYLSFHQILMTLSTLLFVCLTMFAVETSMFMQGIEVLLGAIFCAMTEIVLNVSILTANTNEHQQFYIQIGHGMFGVGGLISPLIVLYLQESTYFYLGLLMFLVVPAYYFLETPQKLKTNLAKQILSAQSIVDQIKRIQIRSSQVSQENVDTNRKNIIVYLLSFMFYIYIGEEVAFGGWISSYSVLNNVATKQSATKYSSLFWGFMTLFRFIFAFIKEKPSKKLIVLIAGQIILTTTVLILTEIFGMYLLASYFSSITLGITFSASYGLFLVLPIEYGMEISCQESSGFLMYGELGQATITMFVGYLMGWITPSMLFWSILLCSCILYWGSNKIVKTLKFNKQSFINQIEMVKLPPYKYDNMIDNGHSLSEKMLPLKSQL